MVLPLVPLLVLLLAQLLAPPPVLKLPRLTHPRTRKTARPWKSPRALLLVPLLAQPLVRKKVVPLVLLLAQLLARKRAQWTQ
jgi:hypothetical protein